MHFIPNLLCKCAPYKLYASSLYVSCAIVSRCQCEDTPESKTQEPPQSLSPPPPPMHASMCLRHMRKCSRSRQEPFARREDAVAKRRLRSWWGAQWCIHITSVVRLAGGRVVRFAMHDCAITVEYTTDRTAYPRAVTRTTHDDGANHLNHLLTFSANMNAYRLYRVCVCVCICICLFVSASEPHLCARALFAHRW